MLQYELKSIKGKRNFQEFFDTAVKFYDKDAALFVCYRKKEEYQDNKLIVNFSCIVRKKNAKKAVVRNRIKRLIRESVRKVFAMYKETEYKSGIESLFVIWGNTPEHPKQINLNVVHPVVTSLIGKAEDYYKSQQGSN